ncbi:MAG: aldo/keto reductase [Acidobacteria bacterium]|nr:aldo/keto reductase [Acidobacteriota bacterium]
MTRLGLGCAPLGNLYEAVTDEDAFGTVHAAFDAGVRWFDTAPLYGHGLSESRLGRALASLPRDEVVLCTKVGRVLRPAGSRRPDTIFRDVPAVDPVFDFSRDGVLRSIENSLHRMGVDRLDVVHVHDPDDHDAQALESAFPTLIELRDQGVIGRVGCGMNQVSMLQRFVQQVDLDCVLLAGRWTLLDRSGAPLLALCAERGVHVVLGGVFNSGVLADPRPGRTFDYLPAGEDVLARARAMAALCAEAGVPLVAAALQFAGRHPAVGTVLVGARSAAEVQADAEHLRLRVPDELWRALEAFQPG